MMTMIVEAVTPDHVAPTTMIGGARAAGMTMTIMVTAARPVSAAGGSAILKAIQKHPGEAGMSAKVTLDPAHVTKTTMIDAGRDTAMTIDDTEAGLVIPKATLRRPVEGGMIPATGPVAGLATAKVIP